MIGIGNVVADLCCKAERRPTRPVRTQTTPACHFSLHFRDKDGMGIGSMMLEPGHSILDAQRLCVSRGLLRGDRLIVDIYNRRKIIELCKANYHLCTLPTF